MKRAFFVAATLLTALAPVIALAVTVQSNLAITVTSPPSSPLPPPPPPPPGTGGDPTVGLLPSNRSAYASWSMAGLTSIGGIPNRTTIFRTLSPSGGDDTAAIQAALNACPANEVVQLTAGVFQINGNGIYFETSNCTLRGAGPGHQLNTGINAPDSPGTYVVDSTATQLIKADRATNRSYGVVYIQSRNLNQGASINLAQDAPVGTYSVTLTSAPSGISAGSIVLIDEDTFNYTEPDVYWGPDFYAGAYGWFDRTYRSLSQLVEVTGVSGNTVTFDTPLHITFTVSNQAQLTPYTGFLREVGLENLFVFGGMGGDHNGNINVNDCAYCWVKNVESTYSIGTGIGFYSTFRSELRDSFTHDSGNPDPGGGGYLSGINTAASDNLFENNIMWSGNKEIVMRASGGGNVVAYNYMDDAFGAGYPNQVEAGVNAGHYTTPHMELLEGNYSQNYKGDSYWGNSIYITVFRNWLSALRAGAHQLKTYMPCYGDYYNRDAVSMQAYSYYTSLVGNVLGMQNQTPENESDSCGNTRQSFIEQVTTSAQDSATPNTDAVMWYIGQLQTNAGWSFVPTAINTQLRQGNWDWVTQKQHWYGIGGTTDGSGTPASIPNSFYLTAKPAFFGTYPWPWVDPTTGTTYTLPAKYCFEHNMMPTCLQ
jgi:hypothetical protein